ncbi:MAG: DUF2958 domain-containing protein [Blastomonas fulva]|jgi:hypothetical protein|uniref:DUF2958 domain-containing protein n=1 Tax=Blastomonas fulva TaxID=1550728 RepID=UPI0024E1E031|nr:DUF2958 domain-containing protein [Blastomonas fulva]MDK2757256.1 DUF2958 domain-containing protein [Blastomonas fulva]
MKLLTKKLAAQLQRNARQRRAAALAHGTPDPDPLPVMRFFNPLGSASWLATELDEDCILFGLADLGFGCLELGSFALFELEAIRLPLGLGIERDIVFEPVLPLSVHTYAARQCGANVTAQGKLAMADSALRARQKDR